MFTLKTTVYGNPDRGQDPRRAPFGVQNTTLQAQTLSDLKDLVTVWQAENDIGAGNWVHPAVFKGGELIGFMSYNGRVWLEKNPSLKSKEYEEQA